MKFLTFQIIKSQSQHIIQNFLTYVTIALPVIIYYPIEVYFFYDYDLFTFQYLISFILNLLISAIIIVNIHRFVILKENNNFYNFNNFKLSLNYFLFGIFLLIFALAPTILTFYLTDIFIDLLRDDYFTSLTGFIAWSVFLVVCVIISLIFIMMIYPFFAFALPKIAVGEKFRIADIWRETKGYRITILLQIIIIFGPIIFIQILFDDTINKYIEIFMYFPSEILAISCLSKTYLLKYGNS